MSPIYRIRDIVRRDCHLDAPIFPYNFFQKPLKNRKGGFLEKNCMRFLEIMRLLNQSIANSIASLGDNSTFKLTLFALLILTIELGVQEWIMRRFYTEECCQEYLI